MLLLKDALHWDREMSQGKKSERLQPLSGETRETGTRRREGSGQLERLWRWRGPDCCVGHGRQQEAASGVTPKVLALGAESELEPRMGKQDSGREGRAHPQGTGF